jgi:hypothetical protein
MPVDILAEAEAVAAARWQATEPSPAGDPAAPLDARAAEPAGGVPVAPRPLAVPATDDDEPWLVRSLLRLDDRLLGLLVVLAMAVLVVSTVLTALATAT